MTGRQPTKPRAAVRRDGSFDAFDMAARQLELEGTIERGRACRAWWTSWRRSADGSGDRTSGGVIAWRIAGIDGRAGPARA